MFNGKCGINRIEMHYIGLCVSDGKNVEGGTHEMHPLLQEFCECT
jgi:hypothetical protein